MDNDKKLFEGLLKADGIDPAGISDTERAAFAKMLDEQSKSKHTKPGNARPDIWRIIMKTRITKLAAAAVIIIAAIIGINHFGGSIDGAGIAFAEVVQQIREARTVTFITEVQVGQQIMRVERACKEPGLKRAVMPGNLVIIEDLTQKRAIAINHLEKQYTNP